MKTLVLIRAAFSTLLVAVATRAATFSTPVNNFADDASGKFAAGAFDFGFRFLQIGRVYVESDSRITVGGGRTTGSSSTFWRIGVTLYDANQQPQFPAHYAVPAIGEPPPTLFGKFNYSEPEHGPRAYISPLNPDSGAGSPPPRQWPAFLLNGTGAVAVQQQTEWSCTMNCSGSGTGETIPIGIAPLRLIVEGTAVPELGTFQFLAIIGIAIGGTRRNRRGYVRG